MSDKNITFTLTRDKADALCTLLSMLEGNNALTGLYHALLSQMRDRPYRYRILQAPRTHGVHKAMMLAMISKHDEQDNNDDDWDDEEDDS